MSELFTGDTFTAAMSAASAQPTASDASPASVPVTPAGEVSSPSVPAATPQAVTDGPTVPPTPAVQATTDTTPPGIPPEQRWPAILENARTKAASEVKAQYAWADQIPESQRATVGNWFQTLDTHPEQAIEAAIVTAANDPIHAPALRSMLGRLLRGGGAPESPTTGSPAASRGAEIPEPDFEDAQGHQFYSAGQIHKLAEAIEARLEAKFSTKLDPLTTDLQTRAARAQQAKQRAEADAWAAKRYEAVSKWEGFAAHEAAIHAAMVADPDLEIGDAYIQIVVPQLSQHAKQGVVAQIQHKVSASSVNPGAPASAVQGPPRDFAEGLRQMGVGASAA